MDSSRLFLAIDGATRTCRARIVTVEGEILGEGRSSSASLRIGATASLLAINNAVSKALSAANLGERVLDDIRVGLGLPGARLNRLKQTFLDQSLPFKRFQLLSDCQTTCLGAHSGTDGGAIIIDTLATGTLYCEGVFFTTGGWDFPVSGFGGGAQTGLALIQAALKAHEGLEVGSDLTRQIMDSFDNDAERLSNWAKRALPDEFANYAPVVFEAAEAGDDVACTILRKLVIDLEQIASTLQVMGADTLALSGELAPLVQPYLSSKTQESLVKPVGDSMFGTLLAAGFPPEGVSAYLAHDKVQPSSGLLSSFSKSGVHGSDSLHKGAEIKGHSPVSPPQELPLPQQDEGAITKLPDSADEADIDIADMDALSSPSEKPSDETPTQAGNDNPQDDLSPQPWYRQVMTDGKER